MRKLAWNDKAMLVKIGHGFWYVTATLTYGCYNEESKDYTVKNAIESFTKLFGNQHTFTPQSNSLDSGGFGCRRRQSR